MLRNLTLNGERDVTGFVMSRLKAPLARRTANLLFAAAALFVVRTGGEVRDDGQERLEHGENDEADDETKNNDHERFNRGGERLKRRFDLLQPWFQFLPDVDRHNSSSRKPVRVV